MRPPRCLSALAWGLLWTLLFGGASAQPFAADGGFGRPERLLTTESRPLVALALDQGRATVAYPTGSALALYDLVDGTQRTTPAAIGIREVRAAGSNLAALQTLWTIRDPVSGNYLHHHHAEVLYETPNLAPLLWLISDRGTTTLLGLRVRAGVNEIVRLDRDQITVLHRSQIQLRGLSGVWQGDDLHLTWLEGFEELSAFGLQSEWTAYAASTATGADVLTPVALGQAAGAVERTITAADAEQVVRAFVSSNGRVVRVLGAGSNLTAFESEATIAGRPIGASIEGAQVGLFIARGDTIFRWRSESDLVSVAWSPMAVLDGWSVQDAAGVTHLVWVGTDVGGDGLVYRSDDRTPMARTPSDRLAAYFGWRPWSYPQEAAGQVLTALLVAVLVATSGLPLLLPIGLLVTRGGGARAQLWGAVVGAGLPVVGLFGALLAGVSAPSLLPLFGGPNGLFGGTLAGSLLAYWLWQRRDIESLPAFILTAATALACVAGITFFLGFRAWLALGWW